MRIPVTYDRMEAFGTFTHEELVAAVKMWIERCDKAESDRAELLAALSALAEACEANMAHADKVMEAEYGGFRTERAQAMYDRVRTATDDASAAIIKTTGVIA